MFVNEFVLCPADTTWGQTLAVPPGYTNAHTHAIHANLYTHRASAQYRLCPADAELTEACFQSHAVPFADGTSMLRWTNGEKLVFNATDVSVGTLPKGSTWRRGPFPRGPWEWYNWARACV